MNQEVLHRRAFRALLVGLAFASAEACSDSGDDTAVGGTSATENGGSATAGAGPGTEGGAPVVVVNGGAAGQAASSSSAGAPQTVGGGAEADGGDEQSAGGDGETSGGARGAGGAADLAVAIDFEARVGNEAFACGQDYSGLGTSAATATPLDFRFYVYDVTLTPVDTNLSPVKLSLTPDGSFQSSRLALLDFEDATGDCAEGTPETYESLEGSLPGGEYQGLSFKVGVPFDLDHADLAAATGPLNYPTLWWSWAAGYRFMKIDFQSSSAGADPFDFHLGSTDCTGSNPAAGEVTACARPNEVTIALPDFELGTSKVVIDYAKLVASADLDVNGGGPPGCMSGPTDPECAPTFPALGLDVTTGAPGSTNQSVFSIAP